MATGTRAEPGPREEAVARPRAGAFGRLRARAATAPPLARHLGLAVLLAVPLWALSAAVGAYTDYNLAAIAYFAIATAGLSLLTGQNGQLSLGHGALMAIGAYTASLLEAHHPLPVAAVLATAIVTTTLAGLVVGVAAARLRGPYLAGATLALAVALPQVATRYASIFGGNQGLTVPPLTHPGWLGDGFPDERWLAWVSLAAALGTFVLLANLSRSRYGRAFRAVRDHEAAAALAGIHVARTQVLAFAVSAACAGLAGALLAFWAGLTAPAGFALGLSLQLLTAAVIGGLGTLPGAVWGAALLVYVPSWTDDLATRGHLSSAVADNLPLAIYGAVLVVAMLVFPHGIQGGLGRLRAFLTGNLHRQRRRGG
jgi:branched-chain amino acid transport system permease protein